MKLQVLNSQIDNSVNFIEEALAGFLEARYVRKCDEYFIAYLSSQTGCSKSCKYCHLTVTGQTSFTDSTHNDYVSQFIQILKHYKKQNNPCSIVHINMMARGEPLSNKVLLESADDLLGKLGETARSEKLATKFNISTIMPLTLKKSLPEIFNYITPTIYYSLYSTDPIWRKKWMPAAMEVETAVQMLKEYQNFSKKIVKIHFPMIEQENDSEDNINSICDLLDKYNLVSEFNLVKYNPYSPEQGKESSPLVIERNLNIIKDRFKFSNKVQVIKKVGEDVKASCGMFVE